MSGDSRGYDDPRTRDWRRGSVNGLGHIAQVLSQLLLEVFRIPHIPRPGLCGWSGSHCKISCVLENRRVGARRVVSWRTSSSGYSLAEGLVETPSLPSPVTQREDSVMDRLCGRERSSLVMRGRNSCSVGLPGKQQEISTVCLIDITGVKAKDESVAEQLSAPHRTGRVVGGARPHAILPRTVLRTSVHASTVAVCTRCSHGGSLRKGGLGGSPGHCSMAQSTPYSVLVLCNWYSVLCTKYQPAAASCGCHHHHHHLLRLEPVFVTPRPPP